MRHGLVGQLVHGVSRVAMICVIGGMAAACSSDAMRFSETPFANPFGSKSEPEPGLTGSVDRGAQPAPRLPRSSVSSAPLAPVAAAPVYNRPVAALPAPARSGSGGWSVEGGTTITVGQSDTITSLASRYGVPASAILSANGVSAVDVVTGKRLVIPVYSTSRAVDRAPSPAPQVLSRQPVATARPAERRIEAVATAPVRPRPGQLAAVPMPEPRSTASIEPRTTAPAKPATTAKVEAAKPAPVAAKPAPVKTEAVAAKPALAAPKVAKAEPIPAARPTTETAKAEPAKEAPKVAAAKPAPKVAAIEPAKPAELAKAVPKEPESTASVAPAAPSAEFRWPARGRVISGFAGANEGINIAVPDGTPVKAAEAGTVAYAGSEVKGYGNLVLIRHDNGYVSAYAHNGDIDVKRGQKVTRGQTIAKSGQTGNVTSPQLHFEIRKGSTPVDPMKYLASN